MDKDFYISIYSAITASVFIFGMLRALFSFYVLVRAAKAMHFKMFGRIVRCPVLFFDTNPVGTFKCNVYEFKPQALFAKA